MDKKSIIGLVACGLLLFAWGPLLRVLNIYAPPPPSEKFSEQTEEKSLDKSDSPVEVVESLDETPTKKATSATLPETSDEVAAVKKDLSELSAQTLLNENILLAIDAEKGGIQYVTLNDYGDTDSEGKMKLGTGWNSLCSISSKVLKPISELTRTDNGLSIKRTDETTGITVVESWQLDPEHDYRLYYSVAIENNGEKAFETNNLRMQCGSIQSESVRQSGKLLRAGGAVELATDLKYIDKDYPKTFDSNKIGKLDSENRAELAQKEFSWIAVHNKYFVFAVKPVENQMSGAALTLKKEAEEPDTVCASANLPAYQIAQGESITLDFDVYAGPKKYNKLAEMESGVEDVMHLRRFLFFKPAWMGWMSRKILASLVGLNNLFGNHKWGYGFAILVVVFVIKMCFWPLTHHSTRSMKKMQKLQPLMKELKEKYKDQPQKLQQKTMELYKENKVNPMGGCLPMFLQIPVFFALFNTLRSAIELRHAEFFWVQDLARPDTLEFITLFPVRPLALIMGCAMVLQSKLMPTTGDPQQKKMMMFMNVFFIFLFYSMPAGLTLYWSINQILTIIQMTISRRLDKEDNEKAAA